MKLRIGTRGSALARTQASHVAERLRAAGLDSELVIIKTSGDRSDAPSFGSIGPQGVFVREIEQALLDGAVDLAVHSFKDLPTRSPPELVIAAVPPREDAADVLLARPAALDEDAGGLLPLRAGCRVGTSSARRRVWLQHFRPDLVVQPLRGNVPTRIRRLVDGDFDAVVLAAAGIDRLTAARALDGALDGLVARRLDPQRFVPAPAQGALAVQCRRDAERVRAALAGLDDADGRARVEAERAALARAEGGCDVAFGAYCVRSGEGLRLAAMLERAGKVYAASADGGGPAEVAARAWETLEGELA
ncbi:MAG TPA: hydroxymethylbilane synthase [Gammaproteobacteria bacterium]